MSNGWVFDVDFAIIGGGVTGLCLAIRLREAFPDRSLVLLSRYANSRSQTAHSQLILHQGFGGVHSPFRPTMESLDATSSRGSLRDAISWWGAHLDEDSTVGTTAGCRFEHDHLCGTHHAYVWCDEDEFVGAERWWELHQNRLLPTMPVASSGPDLFDVVRWYESPEVSLDPQALIANLRGHVEDYVVDVGELSLNIGNGSPEVRGTLDEQTFQLTAKQLILAAGAGNHKLVQGNVSRCTEEKCTLSQNRVTHLLSLTGDDLPMVSGVFFTGQPQGRALYITSRNPAGKVFWTVTDGAFVAQQKSGCAEFTVSSKRMSERGQELLDGLARAAPGLKQMVDLRWAHHWVPQFEGSLGGKFPGIGNNGAPPLWSIEELAPQLIAVWPYKATLVPLACAEVVGRLSDRIMAAPLAQPALPSTSATPIDYFETCTWESISLWP